MQDELVAATEERWIGKGSAIGQGIVVGSMGVYLLVIFGLHPLPILALRIVGAVAIFWAAVRLVTRGSLVVGPSGIRQVWPGRLAATWSEVAGAEAVTERRLGHPNGVRPVVHLRDGRTIDIELGSRRGGTASRLVDAVNCEVLRTTRQEQPPGDL